MIKTISSCLVIALLLVFPLLLIGCGSESGGTTTAAVQSTYQENCSLCHDSGSVADLDIVHSIATNSPEGEITNVAIVGGTVTVYFKLFDSTNNLIPLAVSDSSIRFAIAKLDATGNWQSYINKEETKAAGDPGTAADGTTVQATYEKASTAGGVFTDNEDGTYTYEFSFDITTVTDPISGALIGYDASLTHRIAMQVSGNVANPFVDFVPNDLPLTDPLTPTVDTRDIVMNASCNECHVKLGFHGSDRIQVEYCVTCHNPGSTDANSGNSVDFKVMIHKIHRGEELPSVEAGGEYVIWGHNDSKNDYSTVVYPQDIRNCTKCHDGTTDADNETGDGDNWKNVPTIEACSSCHDRTSFDTPPPDGFDFHVGGAYNDDSQCIVCHPASGGVAGVTDSHVIPAQVAAASMELNIIDVSTAAGTAGALDVTIQFSVRHPITKLEYDITDTTTVDLTPLSFLIGWDTTDYSNTGSDSTPAQAVGASVEDATETGNNIYTLTVADAVPAGVTGSGVVGFQGHPYTDQDGDGDVDDRVPVQSVFMSFAITDATAVPRRDVVDIDKCNNCHGSLSLHGSNRTDEIQVCVICHNANATDIDVRPADATTATDGKAEEAIDFKYMIHAIHAGDNDQHGFREDGIVVYGYRGSVHDYSHVRFPGNLQTCSTCHDGDSYEFPLGSGVLETTVGTGSNLADPDDDKNITPTAAVCSSCHDDIASKSHMAENGGDFSFYEIEPEDETTDTGGPSGTQPAGHTNSTDCATCHS